MTYADAPASAPPLGFWGILGQTFAMSIRHIGVFLTIAVPPWAVIVLLGLALGNVTVGFLTAIIGCVLWALTCSILTHAAFLLHHGDSVDIGDLVRSAISQLPAMLLCFTVAMVAVIFAYQFFFIPGVYVSGLFAVILPVAVIERRGMESITRCEELTRRHRWSTGWLWFLISYVVPLAIFFIGMALFAAIAPEAFEAGELDFGSAVLVITYFTIYNILTCVLAALIYARLLEIEDGYTRIEEVFE